MQKSKLSVLLKTFSEQEIKNFREFVALGFFNKEKVLEKFGNYLCNYHPDYQNPGLEKVKVFKYLYPEKNYNDGLMRNIISDMMRLANEFLVIQNLKKNTFRKDIMLLEELKNRQLESHFLKQKDKTEKLVEEIKFKDEIYYDKKSELSTLYSGFLKVTEDKYIRENPHYQEAADQLTAGFLIKMLYNNTYLLTRQSHISNFRFILNLSDEIETYLESNGKRFLEIAYIKAYYLSFKLIQTQDEKYFYLLKDFFEKNYDVLNTSKSKDIHTVLINYCYAKVTEGRVEFVKQQFELYKQSVEKGTHKGSVNYISNIFFISLVTTGFEAGEFEWVERFISEKIHEVKEDVRNYTLYFCNALNYYWRGKYEMALSELSKVTSDEFAFKHNIKSLTLKIYYDLNDTEPFYSHIDTYKHFILNNRDVHDKVREQVNNYIIYTKRLFDLKNRGYADKKSDAEIIKNEITRSTAIINTIWLLKKAGEI